MKNRLSGNWLYSLPFFILFLAGIRYVGSHVAGGDSAELALSGATLGIAHSPGYPVFTLFHRALDSFLWFGNSAYQQNLASFLFMLAGLALIGVVLVRLTSMKALVFLPLVLGFSTLFQTQSFVAEVFPLAFAWFGLLLLVVFWGPVTPQRLILFSLLAGLGAAVHQTLLLAYPGLLYFLLTGVKLPRKNLFRLLGLSLGFFVLGLAVHLYLPIRSRLDPILDWEDPETFRRFWGLITRERYGFLQLTQDAGARSLDWLAIKTFILNSFDLIESHLGWFGLILAAAGTLLSVVEKKLRRVMISLWAVFLLSGPFFFWLAGSSHVFGGSALYDRFILLPITSVLLIIGAGGSLVWKSRVLAYRVILGVIFFGMLLQAPGVAAHSTGLGPEGPRWNLALREAALLSLRQIPPGSILISDRADEMEFVLAFLLGAEGRRPDIRFIDANAGVSLSAYGEDYYHLWGDRRIARRESVETELVETSTQPVFFATRDPLLTTTYKAPWGSLFRAWPLDRIGGTSGVSWDVVLPWREFKAEERVRRIYADGPIFFGRNLFNQGEFDRAETMFGVAQLWGASDRQVALGFLFQKWGKIWEARRWYQSALDRGVVNESLFSNMGNLLGQYGRLDEAEAVLLKGTRYFPDSVDILYNLGTIYWKKRQWDDVVVYLERVLALNPRHSQALEYLPKALSLDRFVSRQPVVKKPEPAPAASPAQPAPVKKEGKPAPTPEVKEKPAPPARESNEPAVEAEEELPAKPTLEEEADDAQ